jgi:two-component system LytT family response regulator
MAIERAARQTESESQQLQTTRNDGRNYSKRIIIRSRGRIMFIPVATVRWIAAEENYVRICTEAEAHLLREPISRLEERLDPQMFRRVHRSSIVNLEYVKEVRTQSNGESVVILFNGQKLAMSRSYRSRMNRWLMSS